MKVKDFNFPINIWFRRKKIFLRKREEVILRKCDVDKDPKTS